MSIGIGSALGAYEITALLCEGGMGRVFRARDTRLKRDVAIKALPDEFALDAERVARLQIEAEAPAALNHPHIACIHDLLDAGTSRFLVLELVEGETLADRFLLFRSLNPGTGWDLFATPLDRASPPLPVATTAFEEREGQFSPDGRWVAFASNESGRSEVYVQPFPSAGAKWQVSIDGGAPPRWRRDTRELFFIGLDRKLMSVGISAVAPGQPFDAGKPAALFATRIAAGPNPAASNSHQYAVSSDGTRFLINSVVEEVASPPIAVILNWRPPVPK